MNDARTGSQHLIESCSRRSGDDPIFALDREARTRKAAGEDIINATLGALLHDDGRLAVLPTAAQAVREVPALEWAAYAPIEGLPAFRQAVVEDLFGPDGEATAEAVAFATPGGTGALRHAIATFLEPGQALLTTSFYWGPYQTLADEQERALRTFSMFDADGALDLAGLEAALAQTIAAQGRVLLILNDPCHNPTGYSMTAQDWDGVCTVVEQCARTAPVTVVLDNAYAAFGPTHAMTDAVAELRRLASAALVLVAWSASKSFTHYGLRVGALVTLVPEASERGKISHALSSACRGTWGNCNRGGQAAIARLLTEPTLRAAVQADRQVLVDLLHARGASFQHAVDQAGLRYPRYDGGFFSTIFSDTPEEDATRMRTRGVYVVPMPGGLRVGLCALREADVARTVAALAWASGA